MDLSKILSITGKPGLYKVATQAKNGIIVESLADGKKFTAFSNERMSSLEEISIFSQAEDIPLKDIFKSFFDKYEGKACIGHKSDNETLKKVFEEVVPNYDSERVYISDIKKVIQWYNLLAEKEMLSFEDEAIDGTPDESPGNAEATETDKKKKEK